MKKRKMSNFRVRFVDRNADKELYGYREGKHGEYLFLGWIVGDSKRDHKKMTRYWRYDYEAKMGKYTPAYLRECRRKNGVGNWKNR